MAIAPLVQALGTGVVRLEPPQTPNGYVRVFISYPSDYDSDGKILSPGMCIDFWLREEDCIGLSDALRWAGDSQIRNLMGTNING